MRSLPLRRAAGPRACRAPRSAPPLSSLLVGLLALGAPLAQAGCSPSLPRTPTTPSAEFLEADLTQPGVDDDPPLGLQVYPGDTVTLRVQSAEVENLEGLVVDERGVVHIPLAGDVSIAGIPIGEAETRVEQSVQRFDRAARVSILISEGNGHLASVVGGVGSPGRYPVIPGMRLADLLAAAGGISVSEEGVADGDLARARLSRGAEIVPVSLLRALSGDPRHNVRVRPGDTLFVPITPGRVVTVLGQVGGPAVMRYWEGMRLTQALALAGGVTRDGNWGDVRVMRGDAERPQVYSTAVSAVVDGDAHDVVLAPGDIVYVASAGHADLRDVMNSVAYFLSLPITAASITVPQFLIGGAR